MENSGPILAGVCVQLSGQTLWPTGFSMRNLDWAIISQLANMYNVTLTTEEVKHKQ